MFKLVLGRVVMFKLVLLFMVTIGGSLFGPKLEARTPLVLEKTANGERLLDLYSRLLQDRIIFLTSKIDDVVADNIVAQLLFLNSTNSDKDIQLFINSPGGVISSGMAIYDTMNYVKPDVCTYGYGMCASMGAFLLASGAEGKRYSLPHTKIMIHQPLISGMGGQASDIKIQAEEMLRVKDQMIEILSQRTGKTPEQVRKDIDRDNYMTAEEAKEYGLIDKIVSSLP